MVDALLLIGKGDETNVFMDHKHSASLLFIVTALAEMHFVT